MSPEFDTPQTESLPFRNELAKSAYGRAGAAAGGKDLPREQVSAGEPRSLDFAQPGALPPREWNFFRKHQENFARKMASRFSGLLRTDCSINLASMEVVSGRSLMQYWPEPGQLALFKIEPLRGVALVEFAPELAGGMLDRLLGGRGTATAEFRALSEVEVVLFEQISRLFVAEWCAHWSGVAELKPVLLGYEGNSHFRQIAAPQGRMLAISLELNTGNCSGQIHLGLLFDPLEKFVKQLPANSPRPGATETKSAGGPVFSKVNQSFEEAPVSLTAVWPASEMTARDLLGLKVGDVLPMGDGSAHQVEVRLADDLKFTGRPGTLASQWAVELTRLIA